MPKTPNIFAQIFDYNYNDLWLWLPVFFGFGVAFFISFEVAFLEKSEVFFGLFLLSFLGVFLNLHSSRFLIFLAAIIFLSGCFYVIIFNQIFLNHSKITGKIFVDVTARVQEIKNYNNGRNFGLIIVNPSLYASKFESKKAKKKIKPRKIDPLKNFLNLENYQEIDRKFLDYSNNYQNVNWIVKNDVKLFPNPPDRILAITRQKPYIEVNDQVFLRLMLQGPKLKEFKNNFDFRLDNKFKKIGGVGFVIGDVEKLSTAKISNLEEWFLNLRQLIKRSIYNNLQGSLAPIAVALLIGDKSDINSNLMTQIRNSGLAHLLAISGFHLSLAATISFIFWRFILSRSQYLTLNFDLKIIATIFALIAAYFYLNITNLALPAKRAFLMILLGALALLLSKKLNALRGVMTIMLLLILANPYAVFNIGFRLSFAAILILACFYDQKSKEVTDDFAKLRRFLGYFLQIITVSIIIQIATAPFLMQAFQNVAILGFIANVFAIPLVAFLVMPLGFLALFAMIFNFEKYPLLLMDKSLVLLHKLVIFIADCDYSHVASPQLSNWALILAIIGLLLICLIKTPIRWLGIIFFIAAFLTPLLQEKPLILFDSKQQFFAIYDEKEGLVFSKKLRISKKRKLWMKQMNQTKFKTINSIKEPSKNSILSKVNCDKKSCIIIGDKKMLILLKRHQLNEICHNNFDIIVNLTAKYSLPDCINSNKIKIDNIDFLQRGGHFFDKNYNLTTSF